MYFFSRKPKSPAHRSTHEQKQTKHTQHTNKNKLIANNEQRVFLYFPRGLFIGGAFLQEGVHPSSQPPEAGPPLPWVWLRNSDVSLHRKDDLVLLTAAPPSASATASASPSAATSPSASLRSSPTPLGRLSPSPSAPDSTWTPNPEVVIQNSDFRCIFFWFQRIEPEMCRTQIPSKDPVDPRTK